MRGKPRRLPKNRNRANPVAPSNVWEIGKLLKFSQQNSEDLPKKVFSCCTIRLPVVDAGLYRIANSTVVCEIVICVFWGKLRRSVSPPFCQSQNFRDILRGEGYILSFAKLWKKTLDSSIGNITISTIPTIWTRNYWYLWKNLHYLFYLRFAPLRCSRELLWKWSAATVLRAGAR